MENGQANSFALQMDSKRSEGGHMKKRAVVLWMAALMGALCLAGCGGKGDTKETAAQTEDTDGQAGEEESEDSQEASDGQTDVEDNTAILVVSFGTSYNDSRDVTIGAIEESIAKAFPEYEVRRAFTSQIIIDKLKERDGLEIDNVEEALDRAEEDGIKKLVVQPTHLMDGYEYTDLADVLEDYQDQFDQVALGAPLLSSDADFDAAVKALTEKMESYDDGETAICFMGHGTEADSNGVYAKMQEKFKDAGYENYYIGTVEAEPTLDDVLAMLKEKGTYKKVVLEPLMVVAGDHANNDMAGDEEDSWKTILEGEGYEVECILEGLGQIPEIRDIYVEHTQVAVDSISE